MIRVSGLTKDYGIRRAVDDITFEAEQGEILGQALGSILAYQLMNLKPLSLLVVA